MKNIKKAIQRTRRQSEWYCAKEISPLKVSFDDLEDAREAAKAVINQPNSVAKINVEYDWKTSKYINHYMGPNDSYEGTYSVYGTFEKRHKE